MFQRRKNKLYLFHVKKEKNNEKHWSKLYNGISFPYKRLVINIYIIILTMLFRLF